MILVLALSAALFLAIGYLVRRTRRVAAQAEQAVPPPEGETRLNDGIIRWTATGDGPPVLMIHGLGGNLRHFTYGVAPLLSDRFRCIAIDRPGCGWSERANDDFAHLTHQARMIVEFLDREGVGRPLVAGHSLGGALALVLALRHPDKIAGVALIAPLAYPAPEVPPMFRGLAVSGPTLRRALGATVAVPMALRVAQATLDAVFAPEPAPQDFALRAGGMLGLRPKGFVAASADLMVNADLGQTAVEWKRIGVPGGILYGTEDAVLSASDQGERLAEEVAQLSLDLLPGRGHMLPITAPEETAAFIARMAERAGLARAA
ncbi:MAG: alpha/beta hydrolase [Pseudomonadota bacterium]|nr:alpha/beta hydrolase [Pseudomonadota bacterium]MEE3101621.1 alpha/beta hydrolase [Pseudomonadota bacterium]